MTSQDFLHLRLQNQQLIKPHATTPQAVVSHFGAMQSQDFAAAKWAIGLRMKGATDSSIEEAFNNGEILRTHIMRPTWHFVTPQDIRWLLVLTAPRVHRYNGYYYRQTGLDKTIFEKSNKVIRNVLQKEKQLTRTELDHYLKEANIPTANLGLSYSIMQAELEGIICSGPRRGKQFTYMLLDDRAPQTKDIPRDEALGELTKRYFQSHGPALLQDFVWWSGLTMIDAKRGAEIAQLKKASDNDKHYWFTSDLIEKHPISAQLLPPFDEYFVAYKDRSVILDERYKKEMNFGGGMITGAVISGGTIIGTWKRTITKQAVTILLQPFAHLTELESQAIKQASESYGSTFLNLPVTIKITH